MSTVFGLTGTGFNAMRFADIQAALQQAFKSAFGPAINLDDATPEGQLIALLANSNAQIWALVEACYNARSPNTSSGQALDLAASINNVVRLEAVPSSFTVAAENPVTITGTAGTLIASGFQAHVVGNVTATFQTQQDYTVGIGGTVSAEMFCTALAPSGLVGGAIPAPSGTLTIIDTPVAGITAITNALDATLGRDVETDVAFRIRRLESLIVGESSTLDGIYAAVSGLSDVTSCQVYENVTDAVDVNGLPPHSFSVVAEGGSDAEVGKAIWAAKPAGIQSYGSTAVSVLDSQGNAHTINFSRPTLIPLYVKAIITANTNAGEGPIYPADGDAQVAAAILAYGQAMPVGLDVFPVRFYTPILTIAGVDGIQLYIDTVNPPVNQAPITIGLTQLASFDSSRIVASHV